MPKIKKRRDSSGFTRIEFKRRRDKDVMPLSNVCYRKIIDLLNKWASKEYDDAKKSMKAVYKYIHQLPCVYLSELASLFFSPHLNDFEDWKEPYPMYLYAVLTHEQQTRLSITPIELMFNVHRFLQMCPHKFQNLRELELRGNSSILRCNKSMKEVFPSLETLVIKDMEIEKGVIPFLAEMPLKKLIITTEMQNKDVRILCSKTSTVKNTLHTLGLQFSLSNLKIFIRIFKEMPNLEKFIPLPTNIGFVLNECRRQKLFVQRKLNIKTLDIERTQDFSKLLLVLCPKVTEIKLPKMKLTKRILNLISQYNSLETLVFFNRTSIGEVFSIDDKNFKFPTLRNLTIEVRNADSVSLQNLQSFTEMCPNLEKITLTLRNERTNTFTAYLMLRDMLNGTATLEKNFSKKIFPEKLHHLLVVAAELMLAIKSLTESQIRWYGEIDVVRKYFAREIPLEWITGFNNHKELDYSVISDFIEWDEFLVNDRTVGVHKMIVKRKVVR